MASKATWDMRNVTSVQPNLSRRRASSGTAGNPARSWPIRPADATPTPRGSAPSITQGPGTSVSPVRSTCPVRPSGISVLVQAGASPDGKAFAASCAEVIFTSHPAIESAIAFRREMHERAAAFGRTQDAIKLLPAITPYIGRTREEAREFKRELDELIPLPIALDKLETLLGGFDLSGHDLEGPLPALPPEYLQVQSSTRDRVLEAAGHEGATVRKLAYQVAGGRTSSAAIGTAEDVADMLSEWYEAGAADGFIISPPVLASGLEVFVDQVVPILQGARPVPQGTMREKPCATTWASACRKTDTRKTPNCA